MKLVQLEQGSDEWLAWRHTRVTASEAAALNGSNPWIPKTPLQLYELKTGQRTIETTPAMQHGTDNEEAARQAAEGAIGLAFSPVCGETDDEAVAASLDGITFDGKNILELKCPVSGTESKLWQYTEKHGTPPDNYLTQLQVQAFVFDTAETVYFAVYDAYSRKLLLSVYQAEGLRQEFKATLLEPCQAFAAQLKAGTAPAPTERDIQARSDAIWIDAAHNYREAKQAADAATERLNEAKAQLTGLASGQSCAGGGVRLVTFSVNGSIDSKQLNQAALDAGIDPEQFRKQAREQIRITLQEQQS